MMKCKGCNKEIPENEYYFTGHACPSLETNKFGCAPPEYYCKTCMKKFPSYWPKPEFNKDD